MGAWLIVIRGGLLFTLMGNRGGREVCFAY